MNTLEGVALLHLQAAYAGIQNPTQQEWSFVQFINLIVGAELHPTEDTLQREFLSPLFHVVEVHMMVLEVTQLPMNKAGLDIPNPNLSSLDNWYSYCVITGHLVAARSPGADGF